MDIVLLLRLGYLGAASAVLFVHLTPALRDRFLAYGPRATATTTSTTPAEREKAAAAKERTDTVPISHLLDRLAQVKVPHSWFTSFYQLSVLSSLFWATQIFTQGPAFSAIADTIDSSRETMTFRQVLLAWVLFFVQGSRRLYESYAFSRPSAAQMWCGHWVLGLGFYVATGVAIWAEGIPALQHHTLSSADFTLLTPDLGTSLSITLFLLASTLQHQCHAHLASLKSRSDQYTLPSHPAFARLIAPHYTAECTLYLALSILAAPRAAWLNWTLACAGVFVAVNLGVTAHGTKVWYARRFGKKAVQGKWRMIPFID